MKKPLGWGVMWHYLNCASSFLVSGSNSSLIAPIKVNKNSIVGAGSVVVKDVPPNVVVAGNPAKVVKELDENEKMISRADMFSSPKELDDLYLKIDQISLKNNSFFGWIKSKLLPNKNNWWMLLLTKTCKS